MMHSVTADQFIVRCNVKTQKRGRVKAAMRNLATAGCVFHLETTGIGLQCTDVKDLSHHHKVYVKKLWDKKIKQKTKQVDPSYSV